LTKPDLEQIEGGAPTPVAENQLSVELVSGLEKVELLIADLGRLNDFNEKAQKFVSEAEKEMRWNRIARVWVLVAAALVIVAIGLTVREVLINSSFAELRKSGAGFSTIIAASVGGIVLLLVSVTRSVFSTFAERNSGSPMPEHLKGVIDAVSSLTSTK
jgi:hypothetical protein